jgi:inositol hexakisphosphate/diphosphoinositol-pentakisphosphate kinase
LLGVEGSQSQSSSSLAASRKPEPCPVISHLIQRRDLLDDNNAGKEKMQEAKKKLKVSLYMALHLVNCASDFAATRRK